MAVKFNHTILWVRDKDESATFVADILGLPAPTTYGPFRVVQVANDVSLDFLDADDEVHPQHYAFLVDESEFDQILDRIKQRGLAFWADPHKKMPNEINTDDGGKGLYWEEPSGHFLEMITVPYGG
jgi:catechol 2,3-dioxygenase-like lactoylglutathione lyase family enzyme